MNKPLLLLILAGIPDAARALVVDLTPSADAGLRALSPDVSYGASTDFIVGTFGPPGSGTPNRALLRFDIAGAIPAGATIDSVTLTLTDTSMAGVVPSNFELRPMLKSWSEGTGLGGGTAAAGEVTWNARAHGIEAWSAPGGQAGVDFSSTASVSYNTGAGTGTLVFSSTSAFVNDIQTWLDNPSTNNGWVLLSDDEATQRTARRIAAREDLAQAPVLTIAFTPVPEPRSVVLTAALLTAAGLLRRRLR